MEFWSLAGNNLGDPPQGFLGTSDNNPLVVQTGKPSVERLRVDTSGNVGIGTTSPGSVADLGPTLHVKGTTASDAGHWSGRVIASGPTNAVVMGELAGVATLGGHNAALSAWANLALQPAGGKVGIGTSAPTSGLQVESTNADSQVYVSSFAPRIALGNNSNYSSRTQAARIVLATGAGHYGPFSAGDFVLFSEGANGGTAGNIYLGVTNGVTNGGAVTPQMTIRTATGNVGIGTTSPGSVADLGPTLHVKGTTASDAGHWSGRVIASGPTNAVVMGELAGVATLGGHNAALSAWANLALQPAGGNVGIGTTSPATQLHVVGNITVTGDVLLTGADCAEHFDVIGERPLEPGTVVVIDEEGALRESREAYDKKVAGVVSGGGCYRHALVLDKRGSDEGRVPLALVGKVYCKVDACHSPVRVGDLLTSSDTPGHAMKAADPLRAYGSVIGKALKALDGGQGMIPILIALQ